MAGRLFQQNIERSVGESIETIREMPLADRFKKSKAIKVRTPLHEYARRFWFWFWS